MSHIHTPKENPMPAEIQATINKWETSQELLAIGSGAHTTYGHCIADLKGLYRKKGPEYDIKPLQRKFRNNEIKRRSNRDLIFQD